MSSYFWLSSENKVYHHAVAAPCCHEEHTHTTTAQRESPRGRISYLLAHAEIQTSGFYWKTHTRTSAVNDGWLGPSCKKPEERFVWPQWSLTTCVADSLVHCNFNPSHPMRIIFPSQNTPRLQRETKIWIKLSLPACVSSELDQTCLKRKTPYPLKAQE